MRTFKEIFEEGRISVHQFQELSLTDAYRQSYNIFKDLGFTTASTYAIWDFIYRLLPDQIKTPEVSTMKMKASGTNQRPFVVNLINSNSEKIDLSKLKQNMINRDNVSRYLNKEDMGNRRTGKLKDLSRKAGYEVKQDY